MVKLFQVVSIRCVTFVLLHSSFFAYFYFECWSNRSWHLCIHRWQRIILHAALAHNCHLFSYLDLGLSFTPFRVSCHRSIVFWRFYEQALHLATPVSHRFKLSLPTPIVASLFAHILAFCKLAHTNPFVVIVRHRCHESFPFLVLI